MAMSGRLTARTLRQCRVLPTQRIAASTPRYISSASTTRSLLNQSKPSTKSQAQLYQLRLFSSSATRNEQQIGAPNAEAYLASGVIKKAENKVDVKKVLVIGSGGLSIGQAGEFDYSGK